MTARPALPPGVVAYTTTGYNGWMLRDAGGTLLQRPAPSYDEAVAQAWAIHDASPDPWVTYADALEAELAELRARAEAGDEARRVLTILRSCLGARLLGPHGREDEQQWVFEHEVGSTEDGDPVLACACGDTPEAAIVAALEVAP